MWHCSRHARYRQIGNRFRAKRIDPHRARNVFDALLAQIIEREGQLVADLVADDTGDADDTGLSQRFQSRRDIDAVAKDVAALGDYVAEIDADAKFDALVVG